MTEIGKKVLKVHESSGVPRLHPYDDKTGRRFKPGDQLKGKLTIGWGRNLSDVGISANVAAVMLDEDIRDAEAALISLLPAAAGYAPARRDALTNMAYNLGQPVLKTFVDMLGALRRQDWNAAADEMLDSLWARQVGQRSQDLAFMIRTGDYPPDHVARFHDLT